MLGSAPRRLVDRVSTEGDDGFSLVEVIVALSILVLVMMGSAGFFVSSLKKASGQGQRQAAVTLAEQMLEYTRSVPASALVKGRSQSLVAALNASPGTVNLSQDVTTALNPDGSPSNYDAAATGSSSQVVPITQQPTVSSVAYTVRTFINRCYVAADGSCGANSSLTNGWMYRISVGVQWSLNGGQQCTTASGVCEYDVSSLRDAGTDPCFNSNVSYTGCLGVAGTTSQPIITSISPASVSAGSTTTLTLNGSNFVSGAKVTIDSGGSVTYGFVNASQMTVTFSATAGQSGTRTLTLVNPDGGTAKGTFTVGVGSISVSSVSPNSVANGATQTLSINGSGFVNGATVSISSTAGTISGVTYKSSILLTVTIVAKTGPAAAGSWPLTVTNPDGGSDSTAMLTVGAPVGTPVSQPKVTSVAFSPAPPTPIYAGSVYNVTLTGSAYAVGVQVSVDGSGGTITNAVRNGTGTSITFTFTAGVAGPHTFTVTNPDTGSVTSPPFTITAAPTYPAPNIISLAMAGPTTVTVNGTNFVSGATITVNGPGMNNSLRPVTFVSSTKVTFTVPAAPPPRSTYTVTLTNPDGQSDPYNLTTP